MAENAQCSEEGPFFPSTPRYIIQNGIALESGILLAPDWITIGLVLGLSVVLSILLIIALVSPRPLSYLCLIATQAGLDHAMH